MAREGVEALARALDMADRLGRRFMMAMFSAWLADALLPTGALDRAIEVARRAVRLASERTEPWARSVALRVEGQALGLSNSGGGKHGRSGDGRVGKECVSTLKYRRLPIPK